MATILRARYKVRGTTAKIGSQVGLKPYLQKPLIFAAEGGASELPDSGARQFACAAHKSSPPLLAFIITTQAQIKRL